MKKRIVSFLMALVMAVSLLPVSAFAVEDAASSDVPAIVEQEPLEDEESAKDEAPVEDVGPGAGSPRPGRRAAARRRNKYTCGAGRKR